MIADTLLYIQLSQLLKIEVEHCFNQKASILLGWVRKRVRSQHYSK